MFSKRFEKKAFKAAVKDNVKTLYRKTIDAATPQQLFQAVSYAVKEAIIEDQITTQDQFKKDDLLFVFFSVEITMKNIEIIGRTGTIPFLEMKIQNSYTLEQGILKEFISVTENLGTRKDFGHGMVVRDGREKTF